MNSQSNPVVEAFVDALELATVGVKYVNPQHNAKRAFAVKAIIAWLAAHPEPAAVQGEQGK